MNKIKEPLTSHKTPPRQGDKVYARGETGKLRVAYILGEEEEAKNEAYLKRLADSILRKRIKCE
jgi:hypothetical protein